MTPFVYTLAVFGVFHILLDLAVAGFLYWYFRKSDEELEEMDGYAEEKTEKRPYAG